MDSNTKHGESIMATIKEIYANGIELAEILNGWKETGFILSINNETMYDVARRAIASAETILPNASLSFVLAIAESILGTKDGEALENFLRSDLDLVASLKAELAAYTNSGIR